MAVLKFIKEKRMIINEYQCSQCKSKFVFEDIETDTGNRVFVTIKFCPMCSYPITDIEN